MEATPAAKKADETAIKIEKEAPAKKKVVIDEKSVKRTKRYEKSDFRKKFETTRFWWRLASAIFLAGFFFQVLSFSTPYWLAFETGSDVTYVGLWCSCNGTDFSGCTLRNEITSCINIVRGFGGISLVCGITVCFVLLCFIVQMENRRCLTITTVTFCVVIALSNQISTATFGKSSGCSSYGKPKWAWSGAMAFVSILLTMVSGACFFIHELRQCAGLKKERPARNNIGLVAT